MDGKAMAHDFGVYVGHVCGGPGKHIDVSS